MSTPADHIMLTRGHVRVSLDLTTRLNKVLMDAALSHAGGSLDDMARQLSDADFVLDALCKQVELCRVSMAREVVQPVMSEEVAA